MRLGMRTLIGHLPRPQLLGQHRECCALRGNGWGKEACDGGLCVYSPYVLYQYHTLIMDEMERRGYNVTPVERGFVSWKICRRIPKWMNVRGQSPLYKEHDDAYYKECIENLAQKELSWKEKIMFRLLLKDVATKKC